MHPAFRFARENYIARMESLLIEMYRLLAEEEHDQLVTQRIYVSRVSTLSLTLAQVCEFLEFIAAEGSSLLSVGLDGLLTWC
jgi:hypothetical protein